MKVSSMAPFLMLSVDVHVADISLIKHIVGALGPRMTITDRDRTVSVQWLCSKTL